MIINTEDLRVLTLEEYKEGAFRVLEKDFKINIRNLSARQIGDAILHMGQCKIGLESSGLPGEKLDYVLHLFRVCELGLKEKDVEKR